MMGVVTTNDLKNKYKKPKYYIPILLFTGFVIIGNILNHGVISFEGSSMSNLFDFTAMLVLAVGIMIMLISIMSV